MRAGDTALAHDALARLAETTQPCGNDVAAGIEARCRALLSEGAAAEACYREAIGRLGSTRLRPELARAHLLYGEWLRRENRRVGARAQLRTAFTMFDAIGMEAFAERAPGADSHRRDGAQAQGRDRHCADRAGGLHRPAGARRHD